MTVLALDLATIRCGFCVGDGGDTPVAGCWVFPHVGEDLGALALDYETRLLRIIEHRRPSLVVYEAPILVSSRDKLIVVRKLYGLGWGTELVCKRLGIDCREAGLRRIKKELAGNSGAGKADMVAAAQRLGVVLPRTLAEGKEDAADAVGGWLMGLRATNPRLADRWDSRLWSSRGALL